jgi:hypothetical protein
MGKIANDKQKTAAPRVSAAFIANTSGLIGFEDFAAVTGN